MDNVPANTDPNRRAKAESGAAVRLEDLQPTWTDKDGNVHRKRILTGDRTTGKLHLGHYVGSLRNRVKLQHEFDTFILLADVQALTTHWEKPEILRQSVMDVALDYMAVGLIPYEGGEDDGTRAKIVIQSMVPAIAELTVYYGLVTPMSLLTMNPTTKAEAQQHGFSEDDEERAVSDPLFRVFSNELNSLVDKLTIEFLELGKPSFEEVFFAIKYLVQKGDDLELSNAIGLHALHRWNQYADLFTKQYYTIFDSISQVPTIESGSAADKQLNELFESVSAIRQALHDSHTQAPEALHKLWGHIQGHSQMKGKIFIGDGAIFENNEWSREIATRNTIAVLLEGASLRKKLREVILSLRRSRGINSMTYGFLGYPVSQAADITFVNAHLVPVGEDQLPHIELTREVVRRMNKQYGGRSRLLVEPQALIGGGGTLKALDGGAKMSKSLGNAIYLSDTDEAIWSQLKRAVTDPQRERREDPGRPEICNVFAYHKHFNEEVEPAIKDAGLNVPTVAETAELCKSAGIGCVECKKNLAAKLKALLDPIRERRADWEKRPDDLKNVLMEGTRRGIEEGEKTLSRLRQAMKIDYFSKK